MYVPLTTDTVVLLLTRYGTAFYATTFSKTFTQGAREFELEAEFPPPAPGTEGADLPDRVPVDFAEEKVAMETRPLEARDFYASSTNRAVEPFSSMKQQNVDATTEVCPLCECLPCQCDKMKKTFAYELTEQQQKRSGRASLHSLARPTGGEDRPNTREQHDYRLHAAPRNEHHATEADKLGRHGLDKGGPAMGAGPTWEEAVKSGQVNMMTQTAVTLLSAAAVVLCAPPLECSCLPACM